MKKTYNQIDEATSYTTVTIFAEEPEGFNAKIPGHVIVIATPGIVDQHNFLSEIE